MSHMPTITLSTGVDRGADVVVIGLTEAGGNPTLVGLPSDLAKDFQKRFGTGVLLMAQSLGAVADFEHVTVLPAAEQRFVVVGLGQADVSPSQLRRAVGSALRAVAGLKDTADHKVAVSLELADPELVQAAAEGAALGSYAIPRRTAKPRPRSVGRITVVAPNRAELRRAVETAEVVARAVWQARDWQNAPSNELYPETFADAARDWAKDAKVSVEVLDDKALQRDGYGGILAVGGGSVRKARLVRLSWAPRGAKFHLALVGKGITFDSGGLDIKPAGQMADMKCDMSGAAAVITAVRAIAELGLKVRITGYAAMAENMPSGSAYRSGDVLRMYGGRTVENYNTDAEGRLVMADAIARAGEDQPHLIVDVATLTGACMVALGLRTAGLMTSDDETADRVLDAAEVAGEEFWQLPITDDIRAQLESDIADTRSGGKNRYGGALVAGAFLQGFVPEQTSWAHLDIAGPAWNDQAPHGATPKGGTGVGVRTLVALARTLAG